MEISFCPDSIYWGDVATWVASFATLLAVCAALWTSRKALREARQLHIEAIDQRHSEIQAAERERHLNAVAVSLICHLALIQLGAEIDHISRKMQRHIAEGNPILAYNYFFANKPFDPLNTIEWLGEKIFTLPADGTAAVAVVISNWYALEKRQDGNFYSEPPEEATKITTVMTNGMRSMLINIGVALDQVTPLAKESRPNIEARWPGWTGPNSVNAASVAK